ncbi:putative alpha-L-fucosidase 1 isoform X2 [Zingiber officinale]|uniref:putative alpha-L-fucosidase 1 isoform X2 n=1 Tax=Zingiber officinale TaxID=94328 RepID=UPI001C4B07E0|nr:putative alpha-L-fucosidase 1 isoform X2 [Zingiber officinale]
MWKPIYSLGGIVLPLLLLHHACWLFVASHSTPPPLPLPPLPSAAQLRWQLGEMALFFHFGPNTFTDTEWGSGRVSPSVFRPDGLDARQWARAAASGGFARMVLTAKHHDGFCLWPSSYTNYSVLSSPWRAGNGDLVGELADAAREFGIGMGVYLSPWDRHDPAFGNTVEYNEYYLGQMTELLTKYGDILEVFLDGAKGEDIRWVGDELGVAGSTCWSLFNKSAATIGGTNEPYARHGDPAGIDWVPAECDVSIRSGWFWHSSEHPKSALDLLDIYYNSVGRNCFLILNVPPNSTGLISDEDLEVLQDFATLRTAIFSHNLAETATITANSMRGGRSDASFSPLNILHKSIYNYWAPDEGESEWAIFLHFEQLVSFNVIQIQEPIQMGQRVIKFQVDILIHGEWETIVNGTTIGYKRLLRFQMVETHSLRLTINKSRAVPLIAYLGIHVDPFSVVYNSFGAKSSSIKKHSKQKYRSFFGALEVAI